MLELDPTDFFNDTPPDLTELLDTFIKLSKRQRELDAETKEINLKLSEIKGQLAELMGANGLQRMTKDGMTVYLREDLRVWKKGDKEQKEICTYLNQIDLGYMVKEKYEAGALKGRIREMLKQGDPLPDGIGEYFDIIQEMTAVAVLAQ